MGMTCPGVRKLCDDLGFGSIALNEGDESSKGASFTTKCSVKDLVWGKASKAHSVPGVTMLEQLRPSRELLVRLPRPKHPDPISRPRQLP